MNLLAIHNKDKTVDYFDRDRVERAIKYHGLNFNNPAERDIFKLKPVVAHVNAALNNGWN